MPAWFASIVHVPAPRKETVDPETEHTPALPADRVNETGRPELAVAVTVYGAPPTRALGGGDDVKLIVCVARLTPNDCCACGAA